MAIPSPRYIPGIQMPDKRRLVVKRKASIIPAVISPSGQGIQPVRPGFPRRRTEPAVANREFPRQVVVNRQISGIVVTHDSTGISGMTHPLKIKNESAIIVADLFIDTTSFMAWIQFKCRIFQMVYPADSAIRGYIRHIAGQAIHIGSLVFKGVQSIILSISCQHQVSVP